MAIGVGRTKKLQRMYTTHVIPDAMVSLWNNGLQRLSHVVMTGEDPVVERPRLVREFVQFIVKHFLHVDSAPTLSRFFTCRDCLDRMLGMHLVGMERHAFQVRKIKPRPLNMKRLELVTKFFKHADAGQTLKRCCLNFRLTGGVEALLSETLQQEDQSPLVVRLCKNAAVTVVQGRMRSIACSIAAYDDPDLDIGPATGTLVATSMELILRLARFKGYPFALCLMSNKYFPVEKLKHIHVFLNLAPEQLDFTCGLIIHNRAWEEGDESAATRWLLSTPAQAMLDRLVEILLTTSLEVERRHAQIKKWEGSKLVHIANASRNAIATRFLRWRTQQCDHIAKLQRDYHKLVRTNLQALRWSEPAVVAYRPVGVRFSASIQPDTLSATGGSSSASSSTLPAPEAAVSPAKSAADKVLLARKTELLAEARQRIEQVLLQYRLPVTRPQWEQWLHDHQIEFRDKMRTATTDRRRRTLRLRARPDMAVAKKGSRIQPLPAITVPVKSAWAQNLLHRTGWHCIRVKDPKRGTRVLVVFTLLWRGRTHYISFDNLSPPTTPARFVMDEVVLSMEGSIRCISDLEQSLDADKSEVLTLLECTVRGVLAHDAIRDDGVCLIVDKAERITKPAIAPRDREAAADDGEEDEDDPVVIGSDDDSDNALKVVCSGDDASDDSDELAPCSEDSNVDISELKAEAKKTFLKLAPAGPATTPASGGAPGKAKSGKPSLWQNDFFWIRDPPIEVPYIHAKVRLQYQSGAGSMGSSAGPAVLTNVHMSKQVHPSNFGERRDAPIRSLLVLRAWTVWRARQNGWADADSFRKQSIDEEERLLFRDVAALQEPDGLLGNSNANDAFGEVASGLAARLRARPR